MAIAYEHAHFLFVVFFFFYPFILTVALLKAVYVVDTDALLEVIEETEAAKQLSLELRDRVLERLELSGTQLYVHFCLLSFLLCTS